MKRKYRTHSAGFKLKVALEAARNDKTINQIASEYVVSPTQVIEWKKLLTSEGVSIFQNKKSIKATEAYEDVEFLQQQVGRLTVQIERLKKKLGTTS
jgi:transposase